MTGVPFPPRIVRCPACGGDSVYGVDNPSRPFCSPRCRDRDFGAWASESFRIDERPSADDPDEAETGPLA